ncbi:MAG: hypothetical protein M1816_001673 [Peltula sp. TS41687]|nr:MAG: hypothetical protein M1816_001673 [Peltula sp. TS41687]
MDSAVDRYPFPKAVQLNDLAAQTTANSPSSYLPGHPRINLHDAVQLTGFLEREFCSPDLEAMAPFLWVMTTQSSANINPLHRQKVKGREIIITEDPRLHLVWNHNRIFIKPIPEYLLTESFWTRYLADRRDTIRKAALGYLRTYCHLIRHKSDFNIARQEQLGLIPPETEYEQFCNFISQFENIRDCDVSARYSYGELRLTRLNFYVKIFLRKFQFEDLHGQYAAYFSRFYGPLLFAFGILSIILSAMQVEMTVEQVTRGTWSSFWYASRWFSVICIVWIACLSLGLALLFAFKFVDEWVFALRGRWRRGRMEQEMCMKPEA